MRRAAFRWLQALGLLVSAACSQLPRAASYFKTHPTETGAILAGCAAGNHRGEECLNAQEAAAQIRSDQRLKLYKQSFQP